MRRGLTLIELLVAVILCGIVVFIAIQVLRGEHKNYTVTREKVRLQSDAREGMRILEEEIKNTGYRTNASIPASTRILTTTFCSEALYGTTGASFDPAPSSSIYTHTSATGNVDFEMRFYNPGSGSGTALNCPNDIWTIGYKYDYGSKTVYRQAKPKDPSVPANALKASDWAPFLENVDQFSLEYGVLQKNDVLLEPATTTFAASPVWLQQNATVANSGTDWVISNTTGQVVKVVYLEKPLTASGNASDGARSELLDDKNTYRISFTVTANSDFFDGVNGLASTTTEPTSKFVTGGFYDVNGVLVGNTFTFRPVSDNSHLVQYDLVPPASSNAKVFFGIGFQLKQASSSTRTLTINGLKIVRLNKGQYAFQNTVTDAERKTIQAIRLKMQSKNRNELLNFERIIPMVNNGL